MKKLIRETAEEILQEYTNCYSEADEDCLVRMLEKLASNMAREIFEEIERLLDTYSASHHPVGEVYGESYFERGLEDAIAELKKKYESEGAE